MLPWNMHEHQGHSRRQCCNHDEDRTRNYVHERSTPRAKQIQNNILLNAVLLQLTSILIRTIVLNNKPTLRTFESQSRCKVPLHQISTFTQTARRGNSTDGISKTHGWKTEQPKSEKCIKFHSESSEASRKAQEGFGGKSLRHGSVTHASRERHGPGREGPPSPPVSHPGHSRAFRRFSEIRKSSKHVR